MATHIPRPAILIGPSFPRRAVRTRGHVPNDDAALKLLHLVLDQAAADWKRAPKERIEAKTPFAVVFGKRFVFRRRNGLRTKFLTVPCSAVVLYNTKRPHSSLGYRPPAKAAVPWPAAQSQPASPATSTVAAKPTMH